MRNILKAAKFSEADEQIILELIEKTHEVTNFSELVRFLIYKENEQNELNEIEDIKRKISEIDKGLSIFHEQFDLHMDRIDSGWRDPEFDIKNKSKINHDKKIRKIQTRKQTKKFSTPF